MFTQVNENQDLKAQLEKLKQTLLKRKGVKALSLKKTGSANKNDDDGVLAEKAAAPAAASEGGATPGER